MQATRMSAALSALVLAAAPAFAQDATTPDAVTDEVVVEEEVVVDEAPMPADTAVTADATVDVTAAETVSVPPEAIPEGYMPSDWAGYTAEQIIGADIYDTLGDHVSSVSDIVIGTDGAVTEIVTDVGGFLGIGSRSVALSPDQVALYSNADGDLRVYVGITREAIEALPEYVAPAE